MYRPIKIKAKKKNYNPGASKNAIEKLLRERLKLGKIKTIKPIQKK